MFSPWLFCFPVSFLFIRALHTWTTRLRYSIDLCFVSPAFELWDKVPPVKAVERNLKPSQVLRWDAQLVYRIPARWGLEGTSEEHLVQSSLPQQGHFHFAPIVSNGSANDLPNNLVSVGKLLTGVIRSENERKGEKSHSTSEMPAEMPLGGKGTEESDMVCAHEHRTLENAWLCS